MPLISIITPTYDRLKLLRRAIDSVLSQSVTDWEMIIVDDCPERPGEAVVRSYNDPRIRYIKHETNKGGAAARNTAMAASRGKYFAFIDDDDEWLPGILERSLRALEGTPPEVGFCFAAIESQYPDGKKVVTRVPEGIANYHERALGRFAGFMGQTLLVKRVVYEDIGGWDPLFPSHQEIEWVIRITKKYKGCGINKPATRFYPEDGHAHIGNNLPKRIRGRELLLDRYHDEFVKHPKTYAKHLFLLAMWYRNLGQYANARLIMEKTLKTNVTLRYITHYLLLSSSALPYRMLIWLGIVGNPALLQNHKDAL